MEVSVKDRPLKELLNMRWQETSGVNHPANLEEGWALMKNRDALASELLELLAEEEDDVAKAVELAEMLESADFDDAPVNVQAAANVLTDYLSADLEKMGGMNYMHGKKRMKKGAYGKKGKFPMATDGKRHVGTVLRRMFGEVEEEDEATEEEQVEKAFADAWSELPDFTDNLVKAVAEKDTAAILRQLKVLREATEERLAAA